MIYRFTWTAVSTFFSPNFQKESALLAPWIERDQPVVTESLAPLLMLLVRTKLGQWSFGLSAAVIIDSGSGLKSPGVWS